MRLHFIQQARLYLLALIVLFLAEVLLAWLWSAKWTALSSGFVGSLAFAVPPARIELVKQSRSCLDAIEVGEDLSKLKDAVAAEFDRSINRWDIVDSLFIFAGAALLSCSFLITIIEEAMKP